MKACDSCAWPDTCAANDRCAREPLTAEQEARVRQLVAEEVARPHLRPQWWGVDYARAAHRFDDRPPSTGPADDA